MTARTKSPILKWMIGLAVVGALSNGLLIVWMHNNPSPPPDCTRQFQPVQPLYPRLTCAEARAEVDRVARGEASPRPIVLRPMQLTVDAKDVVGPAKLNCDGIEFDVLDANQAASNGPIVFHPGPHAVLAEVLRDGRLHRTRYSICGNIVGRERRGQRSPH